ncbi:adenylate/guanylate cyclase domain-containing protein [Sulfitobacter sediminilitoris]|nr:adenylate/guanylate cyclase domain-containing protein [Sulfitobacter sediminilitoris]
MRDRALTFLERFLEVPEDTPEEIRRYFAYWKVFYALAAVAHVSVLVMAWAADIGFLFWFNCVSIPLFIVCYVLLHRRYYRLAFWMANGELILHGVAATVCIGTLAAFNDFIFPVVVMAFVQPFYSMGRSAFLAGGALAVAAALSYFMHDRAPVYELKAPFDTMFEVVSPIVFAVAMLAMVLPFFAEVRRAEAKLREAYRESEGLLLNILPRPIADRLKRSKGMIADDHDKVAILFADIAGFTDISDKMPPAEVVKLLNEVFSTCDALADRYGVEKIKTIGDAYMVVAGLPGSKGDPEEVAARLALDIERKMWEIRAPHSGEPIKMRIGINSGRVVAGIIGQRKFAYDLWGDAVNVAARMEATGEPGRIQTPEAMAQALATRFEFEPRGEIEVKGKGRMRTSFLVGELSQTGISNAR